MRQRTILLASLWGALACTPSMAEPAPPAGTASIQSVTLDFQSEIKTTIYSDGTVHEDAFDPAKLRYLATRKTRNAPRRSGG